MTNVAHLTLGDRVRERRIQLGLSQQDIAHAIGVTQGAIAKLEDNTHKKTRHLYELAKILKTTPDWLEKGEGTHPAIADRVQNSGDQVAWIMDLGLASAGEWAHIAHNPTTNAMAYWKEINFPRIPVPRAICPHDRCYALEVKGRSMINSNIGEKTFLPGEKIIIDPLKEPNDGDFVIACKKENDGKYHTVFKQYIKDELNDILRSLNNSNAYPDIIFDKNVEIVGVVVGKVDYKI